MLTWSPWREDTWADALPRLLEPMGIRTLRARSARHSESILRSAAVHIAVVDLAIPLDDLAPDSTRSDPAGQRVLDLLSRLDTTPPTVVIKAPGTRREESRNLAAALRFNAFAVVDRASADVETVLRVLQRCMSRHYHGRWPHSPPLPHHLHARWREV